LSLRAAQEEGLVCSVAQQSAATGIKTVYPNSSILRIKMKKLLISFATCVLLAPAFAVAKDMTFSGEIMDSQCAKMGGHASMFKKEGTNDPKACTLACIKMGGKFVLFNGASKAVYQLDDQTKPEPFAGQKVQVMGTLDKATKTIHVTDIKAAS
jgi:hypothetical protein